MTPHQEWLKNHGVGHAHCPKDCEHPQPFVMDGNRLVCGRCWHTEGQLTDMVPCTPDICEEGHTHNEKGHTHEVVSGSAVGVVGLSTGSG